ncbi:flotillin-2-like [Branchiostoma lanceolatum]|uniref:flotillin-2-like n=1 Tax=Branchiostoma lanceolatum TaxID=7740 RepID=UPI0034565881
MGNINTVGPNEALVVSGGCCGADTRKTVIGGWAWAWWLVTDVQRLSLEVMTLNPTCESVETAEGVPLTVTGVAQIKVMTEPELLSTACEQFLGKSVAHIESVILQTLEGHLRAILGTLTVEAIYKDRDQFAQLVREVASPDVGRMGIEVLSFTIKDVFDRVEYLSSLGRSQTAAVKRDADIGVAEAERDAGIREAECEKARMDVRYDADTLIADHDRMFKLKKSEYEMEVQAKKAEANLAYELQAAKVRQKIRNEEIEIEVVERRKQIDIEEKEIQRKDKELIAIVRRPAEAEAYKVQTIAEGKRTQTVKVAQADSGKIKLIGEADASAIEAIGKAEAERMRQKAAAYKMYGDAAMMALVLESLPKIAAEASAPLARTQEIVLLGGEGSRSTQEITKLISELPPAVQALTGVDLSKVLTKVPGAK